MTLTPEHMQPSSTRVSRAGRGRADDTLLAAAAGRRAGVGEARETREALVNGAVSDWKARVCKAVSRKVHTHMVLDLLHTLPRSAGLDRDGTREGVRDARR